MYPKSATSVVAIFGTKQSSRWKTLLFLLGVLCIVVFFHRKLESPVIRWDFQLYYTAGHMIAEGQSSSLYDFAAQADFQNRYVDPSRVVVMPDRPFFYPAATALVFVPLVWLPLDAAYIIWIAVNLLLLWMAVRLLQKEAILPENDWPLIGALLSLPVVSCLLQGQLSIVALFLYTVSFVLARRNRMFLAGLAVGLIAIKFQLMVGFTAIVLIRRCWRFFGGIVTGASAVAIVSVLLVGWRQLLHYRILLRDNLYHQSFRLPEAMINIRGLERMVTGHEAPVGVAVISAAVLIFAAAAWRNEERGFAVAVIATVLTAYHAYAQELTLLFLPLAITVDGLEWNLSRAAAVLIAIPLCTFFPFMFGWHGVTGVMFSMLLTGVMYVRAGRYAQEALVH
jgi:alpha-1,2-mannosyltransferase